MTKLLFAPTDTPTVALERTRLSDDVAAGSNVSCPVDNSTGYADTDFVVLGEPGGESAELQQINQAVTTDSIRVATLKRAHKRLEPVTKYRFNKRKFYGSTSIDGSYVELSGSPVDITVDDQQGTYLEYTGTTYTYFKATYYNSTTLTETDISELTGVLADERLRYCTLWDIRVQAGLTDNEYITDSRLERKRKQAENLIKSYISGVYLLPLTVLPEILQTICTLLAAGYIDFEEFGQDGKGVKWLGEAKGMLKAIQGGTQLLIGPDDQEITRVEGGGGLAMLGKPNSTGGIGQTDAPAMFRVTDSF